jgi:hypothetical protein
MIKHPTLYKKSSLNQVCIWFMESQDDKYRTTSGVQNSENLITTEWTTAEPKNSGKKNETTGAQQALLKVASQYKKKLAQGNYNESVEDIDEDNYFKPMLAQNYEDRPLTKEMFEKLIVFSQPKLDGCLSGNTEIETDKGRIEIKKIVEKNIKCKILSYNEKEKTNEYKSIINRFKNCADSKEKEFQWYEIVTENGEKVKLTGNHLVYLPKLKCYRRADELSIDDEVLLTSI